MKDAYEVLRHKETELARIRREIESLRIVAPMLSDEFHSDRGHEKQDSSEEENPGRDPDPGITGTDGLFSSMNASRPKIWGVLKRGK